MNSQTKFSTTTEYTNLLDALYLWGLENCTANFSKLKESHILEYTKRDVRKNNPPLKFADRLMMDDPFASICEQTLKDGYQDGQNYWVI